MVAWVPVLPWYPALGAWVPMVPRVPWVPWVPGCLGAWVPKVRVRLMCSKIHLLFYSALLFLYFHYSYHVPNYSRQYIQLFPCYYQFFLIKKFVIQC